MKQERFEIRLPASVFEALQRAADARGITRTAMANVAIHDYLHGLPPTATVTPSPESAPPSSPRTPKPEGPPNQTFSTNQVIPLPQDPVKVSEPTPEPAPAPEPLAPVLSTFFRGEGHSLEVELTDELATQLGFLDAKELAEAFPEEVYYDSSKATLWMTRSGFLELALIFDMEDKAHLSSAIRGLLERIDSGLDPTEDQEHPD